VAGRWAGADFAGAERVPSSTDPEVWVRRAENTESVMDVHMNAIAAQVVARVKMLPAVRVPNAVWLPAPPNAAAMSAL
jgi:hypothetical protein